MAIAGLLIHSTEKKLKEVEKTVKGMPEMTTYGIHRKQYVVAVAEASQEELEESLESIRGIPGVLAVKTTFLTKEDDSVV